MSSHLVSLVNFAGMMALTAVAFAVILRNVSGHYSRQVIFGLTLGLGATLVSLQPIMSVNGLQIDPRNLFVACAGAFGGPLAAAISFVMAAITRYLEGYEYAYVCILSLFLASCAGLAWRHYTRNHSHIEPAHLVQLGLFISLSYLCTFLLPRQDWSTIFLKAVPFLTMTNVVGMMILGGYLEWERQRKIRERNLRDQASVDSLTGLRNRRAFELEYNQSVLQDSANGTAFLLIDLDHFKKINDSFGHATGDAVLLDVSQKISENIRSVDLAARYGGEEFAVLLRNASRVQAMAITQRILDAIATAGDADAGLTVTASIGLFWSEQTEALETAFKFADQALYQAKVAGRNQIVVAGAPPPSAITATPARTSRHAWLALKSQGGDVLLRKNPGPDPELQ